MLPGKQYKPEDVVKILRRRIWFVLVPFAVVAAATAVVARQLPDRYQSDTLILVIPQRVPESYVRSTITSRIEDRLQSLSQQLLSRTRLERIVEEFNLYVDERRKGIMEDVIEQMRKDIRIEVVRGDAFRVAYIGDEPRTAMRVTERLASSVIEENLRDRDVLAEGTTQFLEAQLEDARRRLIEHEKKLEDYRKRFAGQLPAQLTANLQVIQNLQLQIQSVLESLNRDRDQRRMVERQLADLQADALTAQPPPLPRTAVTMADGQGPSGGTTRQQLEIAQASLRGLELRLKPDHPDIQLLKRRIRDLERKAEAEALDAPVTEISAERSSSPAEAIVQKRLADLRAELDQLDRQISNRQEEEKRLRSQAAGYQDRVEMAPTRESEMVELTRDYATLQSMYTNLLAKKEEAKIASNLERRQVGEQFKLLDPARLPEKPFSPNRQQINLIGIMAGLAIGLGLIALLEYRDGSFRTDDEIASVLQLPVLAVVPVMLSARERRRLRARQLALGLGLGSTVIVCLAVVAYTFVR
jgi:polysaccharide chain length determinant protein (PEP-CTERM system associated)